MLPDLTGHNGYISERVNRERHPDKVKVKRHGQSKEKVKGDGRDSTGLILMDWVNKGWVSIR